MMMPQIPAGSGQPHFPSRRPGHKKDRAPDRARPARSFICAEPDCRARFASQNAQRRHLRAVHRKERPCPCPHTGCGKRFANKTHLLCHLRIHSKERPFACLHDGCNKRFSQASNMRIHYRLHSGEKPFACPHEACHKRFTQSAHLTCHLRVHSDVKNLVCPEAGCNKRFKRNIDIISHRRVHSGEKPFACRYPDCEKRFSHYTNLVAHHRVHSGAKPFACPYKSCGKHFRQHRHLKDHLGTHSGNTAGTDRLASDPVRSREYSGHPDNPKARLTVSPCRQDLQDTQPQNTASGQAATARLGLWPTTLRAHSRHRPGRNGKVLAPEQQTAVGKALPSPHNLPRQPAGHRPGDRPVLRRGHRTPPAALAIADRTDQILSGLRLAVSPRLPPVPLSADCLNWLARQTEVHSRPAQAAPDPDEAFRQWLMSPGADCGSPAVSPVTDRQQPPGGQGL